MSAGKGMNMSSLEDLGPGRSLSTHTPSSASFTVVQALVSLLTQGGWHARLLQAQLSGDKSELHTTLWLQLVLTSVMGKQLRIFSCQ